MKRYLGLVRVLDEHMAGVTVKLLSMFSDDKETLLKWFKLYKGAETIILDNTRELESFFEFFNIFTPPLDKIRTYEFK
jgi:hypothetical protein